MPNREQNRSQKRWAQLRFSIVGPLLSCPPHRGHLHEELKRLSEKLWRHPTSGELMRFSFTTIERWFYIARAERVDPVRVLERKPRHDLGQQPSLSESLRQALVAQYREHTGWSYQLHHENLAVLVEQDASLGPMPSYASVRRFMKRHGFRKKRRRKGGPGVEKAEQKLESREVRSFEAEYVNGLWHLDFHHGSLKVLTARGEWVHPLLFCVIDDCSRLVCHLQWYLRETAEVLVHGLIQAFLKRGLPRALMTDNGSAMLAAEVREGLLRLGIVHETTLPYSPYQNGKQEVFWGQVEGRLLAMLEGCRELDLSQLNKATLAWAEMEYQKKRHSELATSPLKRWLDGPSVARDCPSMDSLHSAFRRERVRRQRHSDSTISVEGVRFELPSRFRHLSHVCIRYTKWDLTHVSLVDERRGNVLARLLPLDKTKNAHGRRKSLEPTTENNDMSRPSASEPAPLMRKLLEQYAQTGLPPAYIPKPDSESKEKP